MSLRDVGKQQEELRKAVEILNRLIAKDQIIEAVMFIGVKSKETSKPSDLITLTAGEISCAMIGCMEMFKIRTYLGEQGQSLDGIQIESDEGPDGPEGKGPNGKK